MIDLSIVVPCYNEQEVIEETVRRLLQILGTLQAEGKIDERSQIVLVDDGSVDRTWPLIVELAGRHREIEGIKLSRNRGHQNALIAGLFTADGDAVVSVDADLQDDLAAIREMVEAHANGADIVYGVRRRRDNDTFFKRWTAEWYYRLLSVMGVENVFNHADYRLMSRRALTALREYGEVNMFLRGIVPQLGFPSAIVYYDRRERHAGVSKYPIRKMLAFAVEGITSFSAFPLRLITTLGFTVSLVSFGVILWALSVRFLTSASVPGWASTVLPIYFLGGVQLLCLGIIGEYLAKIYMETKRRPRFVIEQLVSSRDNYDGPHAAVPIGARASQVQEGANAFSR